MATGDLPGSPQVVALGLPSDENSSFLRGPARGPAHLREALHCGSMNLCSESGIDLGDETRFRDLGDLEPLQGGVYGNIEGRIGELLDAGHRVLSIGGDHAVSYPILRAYGPRFPGLTLLHLDAHSDLYEEYEGSRTSHACPFARILEDGLIKRLVQVGIRTLNAAQRTQVERYGVEVIEAGQLTSDLQLELQGPVYISLDLDVLDPAFAPGVSHHEPGGLSVREVLAILQNVRAPVVGADLVELNPSRDPLGQTAAVGAKLYKELAALLLSTPSGSRPKA